MTQLLSPNSPLARAQSRHETRLSSPRGSGRRLSVQESATLKRVLEEKYEWIDDEAYHQPDEDAARELFTDAPPLPTPDTDWYHPVMDSFKAIRESKNNAQVLLTAAEERVIFKMYNYSRFRVCRLRDQLKDEPTMDVDIARELLDWHAKAEGYRTQIARLNLALVLAMAKRTRMNEVDFADLVSEGNMALLRAVDKFDVSRGFKFSTYACRAILKAFSRAGIKLSKHRSMFPTDFDPKLERSNHAENKRDEHEDDCVDEIRRIIKDNRADLSDIETEVIEHRFAVGRQRRPDGELSPLTLEQVGRIIGVTKERVRQIQNKALDKIRTSLEEDFLD